MRRQRIHIVLGLVLVLLLAAACSERKDSQGRMNDEIGGIDRFTEYRLSGTGLACMIPEEWIEYSPGQFQPEPGTDPTMLSLGAFPEADLGQVKDNWQLPELFGTMESTDMLWEIYKAEVEIPNAGVLVFSFSLAESEYGVHLVSLATSSEKAEELYQQVLLPVLRSVNPVSSASTEFLSGRTTAIASTNHLVEPVDTLVRETDGMTMVYVPAGEFIMGNDGTQWVWNGRIESSDLGIQIYTDESPAHAVYLDAYWIDQTEVTVSMFSTFVEETGYQTTAERDGWGSPWTEGPIEDEWPQVEGINWKHPDGLDSIAQENHPVVQVSWDDAAAYCYWAGGMLPTEAQWEKAARGTDNRWWPWGDVFDTAAGNFCGQSCPVLRYQAANMDDGFPLTAPVGSFPSGASPYGALDMAGNVWEWTADWYSEDTYCESFADNPTGPSFGMERVQRGGAWIDNQSWVRTTVRHSTPGWVRCNDLGFRCVMPAKRY